MGFDDIYELIQFNQIKDNRDLQITKLILQAEQQWIGNHKDLSDFLRKIKLEIGKTTNITFKTLTEQINIYKSTQTEETNWKISSFQNLIALFNYSGYSHLELIFEKLGNSLNDANRNEKVLFYEEKGFPSIKIFENKFEIKSQSYAQYRTFYFSDIKQIRIIDESNNPFQQAYVRTSIVARFFAKTEPLQLKIINRSGGIWEYQIPNKLNENFHNIISKLKKLSD